jgi:hypothetical protein
VNIISHNIVIENLDQTKEFLAHVEQGLSPAGTDKVVEVVAQKTQAALVQKTIDAIGVGTRFSHPRWNIAKPEQGWKVETPGVGTRDVVNNNKVMTFLERGTANGGSGWITPKVKKMLYIPLTAIAALGWTPALIRQRIVKGVVIPGDYLLAKRVRGIRPRGVVAKQIPETKAMLVQALMDHLRQLIRSGRKAGL